MPQKVTDEEKVGLSQDIRGDVVLSWEHGGQGTVLDRVFLNNVHLEPGDNLRITSIVNFDNGYLESKSCDMKIDRVDNSYVDGCDPLIGDRVEDMCGTDGTCAPINQVGGFRTQVEDLLTPVRKKEKVYTKYEYKTLSNVAYYELEDVLIKYGAEGWIYDGITRWLNPEQTSFDILLMREQEN